MHQFAARRLWLEQLAASDAIYERLGLTVNARCVILRQNFELNRNNFLIVID
tara:strand:- start:19109 stop:19264 length:156 start_codon:yes stop_codon:yes gene_type:complete